MHSYTLHILLNISAINLQIGKRINSYISLINYADMMLNRFQVGHNKFSAVDMEMIFPTVTASRRRAPKTLCFVTGNCTLQHYFPS